LKRRGSWEDQDFVDLAIHYSLAWTGAMARRDPPYASLIAKDRDFTESDKQILHQAQVKNVASILPLHKKLAERGQIELTTTPFYHPILPLLVDTDSALEEMPYVALPAKRFAHPEEADNQLRRARAFFKSRLGIEPKGLWPSEGSVSQDVLALIHKNGFEWTATDEGVLANSIKDTKVTVGSIAIELEHAKYFPWRSETSEGALAIFFRDHSLSDDIGFTYHRWNAKEAVQHFVGNVLRIRESLVAAYGEKILDDAVISVILDGENCWEYYPDNGFAFLDTLYSALAEHTLIAPVTFTEALGSGDEKRLPVLPRLVAGSWINANFRIWIGHPEDNAAWEAVTAAKEAYDRVRARAKGLDGTARTTILAQLALAHEELMIAEGSDWCWWYGDEHHNAQSNIFDELFRMHVRAVYVHLDLTVPSNLMRPISLAMGNGGLGNEGSDKKYGSMHRVDG